jgi:hypothetical protein
MIIPEQIRAQLGRVLASSAFDQADRASAFLRFIVTTSLEGRASEIKESVIAVEALGRTTSFDPKSDPIVRVEAGRLRTRLKAYYDAEGSQDPILITLPKGGYIPEFAIRTPPGGAYKRTESVCADRGRNVGWARAGYYRISTFAQSAGASERAASVVDTTARFHDPEFADFAGRENGRVHRSSTESDDALGAPAGFPGSESDSWYGAGHASVLVA